MSKLLTPEGLKKLQDELEERKGAVRRRIARSIKEAKEQGDLSENAEYSEAKRQHSENERRIIELENTIRTSRVASFNEKINAVQIGSKVKVKFDSSEQEFAIVGSNEADPGDGKISNESPIGRALLGRSKGEKVSVKTPVGELAYEILEIN
jgi:transcription elongation factor GreA